MRWKVQGLNAGGGSIVCILQDRPWGPPSLLYTGYQVFFPELKQLGHGVDCPFPI